MFEQTMT